MMSLESYTTAHESATSSAYFDDSLSRRARYMAIVLKWRLFSFYVEIIF